VTSLHPVYEGLPISFVDMLHFFQIMALRETQVSLQRICHQQCHISTYQIVALESGIRWWLRPGHWFEPVLRVSFSALTLGWVTGRHLARKNLCHWWVDMQTFSSGTRGRKLYANWLVANALEFFHTVLTFELPAPLADLIVWMYSMYRPSFLLHVCLYVYVVIQPLAAKPNKSVKKMQV